jgi:hypothetical protein
MPFHFLGLSSNHSILPHKCVHGKPSNALGVAANRWQVPKLDEGWPENVAPRGIRPLAWPVIDVVER